MALPCSSVQRPGGLRYKERLKTALYNGGIQVICWGPTSTPSSLSPGKKEKVKVENFCMISVQFKSKTNQISDNLPFPRQMYVLSS